MILIALLLLATTALGTQQTIQMLDESPLQKAIEEIEQAEFGNAIDLYPALTNNIDREAFFKAMFAAGPDLLEVDDLPRVAAAFRSYIQINPRTHVDDEITTKWKHALTSNDHTLFFAKRYMAAPAARAAVPAAVRPPAASSSAALPEPTLAFEAGDPNATLAYHDPATAAKNSKSSAASSSSASSSAPKDFYLHSKGARVRVRYDAAQSPDISRALAATAKNGKQYFTLPFTKHLVEDLAKAINQLYSSGFFRGAHYIADYILSKKPYTADTIITQVLPAAALLQAPGIAQAAVMRLAEIYAHESDVDWARVKKNVPAHLLPLFTLWFYIHTGHNVDAQAGLPPQTFNPKQLMALDWLPYQITWSTSNMAPFKAAVNNAISRESHQHPGRQLRILRAFLRLPASIPIDEKYVQEKIAKIYARLSPPTSSSSTTTK